MLLIARSQPGRRSSGTFAPETSSIEPPIMSAKSETLRPRRPSEPRQSPNEVHAKDETAPATARPASSDAAKCTSRMKLQIVNASTATRKPVQIEGTARPRKSAKRFAGDASRVESVWERRSPPIAFPIPKKPVIAIAMNAFPIRKNLSDCTFANRPR